MLVVRVSSLPGPLSWGIPLPLGIAEELIRGLGVLAGLLLLWGPRGLAGRLRRWGLATGAAGAAAALRLAMGLADSLAELERCTLVEVRDGGTAVEVKLA